LSYRRLFYIILIFKSLKVNVFYPWKQFNNTGFALSCLLCYTFSMKFLYILLILFLSSLIGTVIGEFIIYFFPNTSPYYSFLSFRLSPTWEVAHLNLIVFDFSFSFKFYVNLFTLVGLICGSIFSLRKV